MGDGDDDGTPATLSAAYADFNTTNVKVSLSGSNEVIERNGYPDDTSFYSSPTIQFAVTYQPEVGRYRATSTTSADGTR